MSHVGARAYHCKSRETEVGLLQVRGQSRLLTQQIPGQPGLETKILSKNPSSPDSAKNTDQFLNFTSAKQNLKLVVKCGELLHQKFTNLFKPNFLQKLLDLELYNILLKICLIKAGSGGTCL